MQVIGSFTNPPWERKVELDFCPLRAIFVKYMSNLTEGTYLIKFIVDGEFKCDMHLPVITDASGHHNNLLEIVIDDNEAESGRNNSVLGGGHTESVTSSLARGLKGTRKQSKGSSSNRHSNRGKAGR